MLSPESFIRRSPATLLRRYYDAAGIQIPSDLNDGPDFRKAAIEIFSELPISRRHRFVDAAERVSAMTDELGYAALLSVSPAGAPIDLKETALARALRVFLDDHANFVRAESVRFSDERRFGRQWASYSVGATTELNLPNDLATRLQIAFANMFEGSRVHVEIFRRVRQSDPDRAGSTDLVQITIFREDRPREELAFSGDGLTTVERRPVLEGSVTYEPASGVIEVVQKDKGSRAELAKRVALELLGAAFDGERIPLRRYDLASLMVEREFPVDVEDRIEKVSVTSLRLAPIGSSARVTIEVAREGPPIWAWLREQFGARTPLRHGWAITQARLVVTFLPAPGSARSKLLSMTITMPQGCDLKERNSRERLVGDKYLTRWGLLEVTDAAA